MDETSVQERERLPHFAVIRSHGTEDSLNTVNQYQII